MSPPSQAEKPIEYKIYTTLLHLCFDDMAMEELAITASEYTRLSSPSP